MENKLTYKEKKIIINILNQVNVRVDQARQVLVIVDKLEKQMAIDAAKEPKAAAEEVKPEANGEATQVAGEVLESTPPTQ